MANQPKRELRWLKLDNAAKIYPAARRQNWTNIFRMSVTLTEAVDTQILQSALDATVPRFPSMAARLCRGLFWYYLEQVEHAPRIQQDYSYPVSRMSSEDLGRCALRVMVYGNRIAVEMFHSLTDGSGALIFLKTLTAEYLRRKYGIAIPCEQGVMDLSEAPKPQELEDSFPKYAGNLSASRKENNSWRLTGTPEEDGFRHVTCLEVPVQAALDKAHEYGVTLTAFLASAMLAALQDLQAERIPEVHRRPPIRVLVPVNLRFLFPSQTLRNFAMYSTPEILPRLGRYSFPEICQEVTHRMGVENTAKQMSMKIATNVASEKLMAVKIMPLFIKNAVMKAIFNAVGEKKSCLSLSNLGRVQVPDAMAPYIQRFDFILGIQATAPYNCGVLSWGDTLYINFIRDTKEPALERCFHCVLRDMGLPVQVRSNNRQEA